MSRIAVVTGGASGIGKAISERLVARGDSVVVADVNGDGAAQVAEQLTASGPGTATGVQLDVRDAEAVADCYRKAAADGGRLDLVFNNAGIAIGGEVEELTVEHWDRIIAVNLSGVAYGVAAAYPLMVRQGFGHIVNTASLAGLVPAPFLTPYVMTKHGVVGLSLALRAEARHFGVKVTAICPSFVDTPMVRNPTGTTDLPSTPLMQRAGEMQNANRAYDVSKLARDVMRGVDRNKALIVTPFNAQVMWRLQRFAPWLLQGITERGVSVVRRRLAKA